METCISPPAFEVADVIREVTALANEFPDNRYNKPTEEPPEGEVATCRYDKGICTNGSVGCIFGQALRKLGYYTDKVMPILNLLRDELKLSISEEENVWCWRMQKTQDNGNTWVESLRRANIEVAELKSRVQKFKKNFNANT